MDRRIIPTGKAGENNRMKVSGLLIRFLPTILPVLLYKMYNQKPISLSLKHFLK